MKISVCIATYNGEKYIIEQLASILSQISAVDEVIISDDGSSDRTIELIEKFDDNRIKVFYSSKQDLIKNFENAIKHSSGDVIFTSDQDDIWAPDKIEKVMAKFKEGFDLVLHNCSVINDKKEVLVQSYFNLRNSDTGLFKNLFKKNSYMGCCMAFTSKVKEAALPFPKNIPMHDQWIGLIGEIKFKSCILNSILLFYRQHETNASYTATAKSGYSLIKKSKFRLVAFYYLFKRFFVLKLRNVN